MLLASERQESSETSGVDVGKAVLALWAFAGAAVAAVVLCYFLVLIVEIGAPQRLQRYAQAHVCASRQSMR